MREWLREARRPRWIGALLLALVVAGVFAFLGRWQLERALSQREVVSQPTEQVRPLTDTLSPNAYLPESAVGQRVSTTASFVPGSGVVVSDRMNGGRRGYWAVFRAGTADGAALAIAVGWSESLATASAAAAAPPPPGPQAVTGRLVPSESPALSDTVAAAPPVAGAQDGANTGGANPTPGAAHVARGVSPVPPVLPTLALAELVNLWEPPPASAYFAYVVIATAWPDLSVIDSPAPQPQRDVNWLNLFYALEWVVFAGFALYLWYRLVRDAVQRREEARLATSGGSAPGQNEPHEPESKMLE